MAIIGRLACSLCDFQNAHVKENKPKLPYQHCPDCGAMLTTKSRYQARLMLAKMRPMGDDAPAPAPASAPAPKPERTAPAPAPAAPAAPAARQSFWAQMAGTKP